MYINNFKSFRISERHLFSAVESGKLHDVKQMLSVLPFNPKDKVSQ